MLKLNDYNDFGFPLDFTMVTCGARSAAEED